MECGDGYAGVAVEQGRVYLMDYDKDKKQNALRCLSLANGGEIWRYAYNLTVKQNHGMTRVVPAVSDKFVVAMDPKCHVLCLDAVTGELLWSTNLVSEFGTTVPQWYAGQCPLLESNAVILAPGGHDALLAAVDLATGKNLWRSPNPRGWKMTHSSIMPMEFAGRRFYVYCASGGVAGISAKDGALLWETNSWKISIANVPSPLVLDGGRILLSGGYDAGSMLLQLRDQDGKLVPETVWRLGPKVFGATQHTPILHDGLVYGTRPERPIRLPGSGRQNSLGQPGGRSLRSGSISLCQRSFLRDERFGQTESCGSLAVALQPAGAGDGVAPATNRGGRWRWSAAVCWRATSPAWSAWMWRRPRSQSK